VAATIGTPDALLYTSPLPELLFEASGITPVDAGTHVMLDEYGIATSQRLAIGDLDGTFPGGTFRIATGRSSFDLATGPSPASRPSSEP
jgi:hypothetical protein